MKVLTNYEAFEVLAVGGKGSPSYFDDNISEWVDWLYKNNYRLVKIQSSTPKVNENES